jgi:preprotein translocase subunit SecA
MKSMMGKLGVAEDEAIEHRIISRSLESAQEKIEGFNFDARKHVLEFDDVINTQRGSVYGRRRRLLLGSVDDVEKELNEIVGDTSSAANDTQLIITKKIADFGREAFLNAMRIVLLQAIDMYWVEHLEVMDYTRSSVNLRAYGQRDPLVEYKKEGLRLFKEMGAAMSGQIIRILPNIVPIVNGQPMAQGGQNSAKNPAASREAGQLTEVHENARTIGAGDGSAGGQSTGGISKKPEVGRNDPCPCGAINPATGKVYKWKNCGMINAPHHTK